MSEEEYPRLMQQFMGVLQPEEAIAQKKAIAMGIHAYPLSSGAIVCD